MAVSTRPAVSRRTQFRLRALLAGLGTYGALGLIALFCLLPFAWLILAAFDPHAGLYLNIPHSLSLINFNHIFTSDTDAGSLLKSSLIMAGGAVVLVIAACTLAAYTLSRLRFPGKQVLMYTILLSRLVPPTATIVPVYTIFLNLHLLNTYQGMILVLAANQVPLVLWILKGFFDTVPMELEQAAWIDGAGRFSSVLRIVFPLALPGVAAAALFAFIEAWGEFLLPLVLMTDESKQPLSLGLYRAFQSSYLVDWGQLTAMSVLYMVPAVLFYLLARRYLIRATVAGALTAA